MTSSQLKSYSLRSRELHGEKHETLFIYLFIHSFLAVLNLPCYTQIIFSCRQWGLLFFVVYGLLIADHRSMDFRSCGSSFSSVQSSTVTQSCPTVCNPLNLSTPGLPVHHQLPEFTQTHVHWVGDAIQPSHALSFPSPLAPNLSQHQGLFQWVNSSHEMAKVLEFQLQHQSFQ